MVTISNAVNDIVPRDQVITEFLGHSYYRIEEYKGRKLVVVEGNYCVASRLKNEDEDHYYRIEYNNANMYLDDLLKFGSFARRNKVYDLCYHLKGKVSKRMNKDECLISMNTYFGTDRNYLPFESLSIDTPCGNYKE